MDSGFTLQIRPFLGVGLRYGIDKSAIAHRELPALCSSTGIFSHDGFVWSSFLVSSIRLLFSQSLAFAEALAD